jgi:hypothetical protein
MGSPVESPRSDDTRLLAALVNTDAALTTLPSSRVSPDFSRVSNL